MVKRNFSIFFLIVWQASLGHAEQKVWTLPEVSQHNTPASCYIVVEKNVYDITPDLIKHDKDFKTSLTQWCGQDASQAWATKAGQGKEHSKKAHLMLKKRLIGVLAK